MPHFTTSMSSTGIHSLSIGLYQQEQRGQFAEHSNHRKMSFSIKNFYKKCHETFVRLIVEEDIVLHKCSVMGQSTKQSTLDEIKT